jgi:hypothetical protein
LTEKKFAAWKKAHHYKADPDAKASGVGAYKRESPDRYF